MIKEVIDKDSGAILFKKDEESQLVDRLAKKVLELESRIQCLENIIENNYKEEDSN